MSLFYNVLQFLVGMALPPALYEWWYWKRRTLRLEAEHQPDLLLANWTRNTMLMVTTRTGYVYAANLEDLANDEMGSCRNWAEPASVVISYGPKDFVANLRETANSSWDPDA